MQIRSSPARGTVTRSGRNPLAGVRGAVRRVGPGPGTAGTRYTDHDTKGPDLDRIRGLLCYLDARANTARTTKPPPSRDVSSLRGRTIHEHRTHSVARTDRLHHKRSLASPEARAGSEQPLPGRVALSWTRERTEAAPDTRQEDQLPCASRL